MLKYTDLTMDCIFNCLVSDRSTASLTVYHGVSWQCLVENVIRRPKNDGSLIFNTPEPFLSMKTDWNGLADRLTNH